MNIDYLLALYNHSSSVVAQELTQLQNLQRLDYIIIGLIVYYVSKKISSYAHSFIPRLIFVLIAIYGVWQQLHSHYIIFGLGLWSGAGFIQPHIQYMLFGAVRFYESTKALTYNTYTLFLTIFYKIYRVLRWFYDIYKKVDTFFQKRKYDKTKAKYESKQEKQRQKEQNQQDSYYEKQEYKNSYQQEEKTSNRDNQYSNNGYSSNNQSNYQEETSYTNNSYEEPSYTSNDEFAQFYSDDDYVVLGVLRTDGYTTIKKSYRDLAMMYHPDKNYEEWDKYNEIFQRINEAHDNLKKRHK